MNCDCENFKQITLQKWDRAQEVCKHVALITLYCHEHLRENYHGQRFFTTKIVFKRVLEMLKSFNADRNLNEKKKHPKFFLYPAPIPSPLRRFDYYPKKTAALLALNKEVNNGWFSESYNRESSQGKKPECKACGKVINLGVLCIRNDYTYIWQNPNYRNTDFTLTCAPFRVCNSLECVKQVNKKINTDRRLRDLSNITQVTQVRTDSIYDEDKQKILNTFKTSSIIILSDD